MDVDVEIHRAAEALKHSDAAATGMRDAVRLSPRAQMPFDRSVQDARHPSAQVVTPRQDVAQSKRQCQFPLPDRHVGDDMVDEVRGAFGHAPPAATGTEPASFARERHKPLGRTVRAPKPREAPGQEAAAQNPAELVFHEPREALTVAHSRGLGEETLDVLPDHGVQGRGTRIAWRVLDGGHAGIGADDMPPRRRPECSSARRSRDALCRMLRTEERAPVAGIANEARPNGASGR